MKKTSLRSDVDLASVLRVVFLAVVAGAFVWLALNVRLPALDELRALLTGYGAWSWLVFVAAYAVVGLTPIPVTIMAVAGGLFFGPLVGSLLSVVGAALGSLGAYGIARLAGHTVVMKCLGKHADRIEDALSERGFLSILVLRCAPGVPYWPVNYGAGAVGVPLGTYTAASLLGTVPGQVSLVAIGAFAARPGVLNGVVVGVSWAAVVALTWWSARRWKQQRDEAQKDDDGRSPSGDSSPSHPAGSADEDG